MLILRISTSRAYTEAKPNWEGCVHVLKMMVTDSLLLRENSNYIKAIGLSSAKFQQHVENRDMHVGKRRVHPTPPDL